MTASSHSRLSAGDRDLARRRFQDGTRLFAAFRDLTALVLHCRGVARLEAVTGRMDRALRLIGASNALRDRTGAGLLDVNEALLAAFDTEATESLAASGYTRADTERLIAKGARFSPDEAVADPVRPISPAIRRLVAPRGRRRQGLRSTRPLDGGGRAQGVVMSIGVIVECTFKPGSEGPALMTELMSQRLPSVTRGYDGCEHVHLYADRTDPSRLFLLERWESREKYDAYREWALAQPGTEALVAHLEREMTYTYLDDTGA